MESFLDRLADFIRNLISDPAGSSSGPRSRSDGRGADPGWRDPDLRAAWEELDDYLRGGSDSARRPGGAGGASGHARRPEPPADESLRADFENLEVPFGSDIDTVRRSYKSLVLRYHPDRFAGSPEKQKAALEKTKKINESFERIRNRKG